MTEDIPDHLRPIKDKFEEAIDMLTWGDDFIKSTGTLNNWLLGIPTTTLILTIANYKNFFVDEGLYEPEFFIGILAFNFLIVLVFGFYKVLFEVSKVRTELFKAIFENLTSRADEQFKKFYDDLMQKYSKQDFKTEKEAIAFFDKEMDNKDGIPANIYDEITKHFRNRAKQRRLILFASTVYQWVYGLAWSPFILAMSYVFMYILSTK